ncbi:MAG: bifunctional tetrahydrofolate synthase/dihydrofolate synthase [Gammaproteobacteria bacterium]|nr:bifunctional tetrahydrofolate synthase/dihydrofolate synthase [Gammaproteobacteria bacterium]
MAASSADTQAGPEGRGPQTLAEWLRWQEALHVRDIDLGLERCRSVAERMVLLPPPYPVVTVAGTNGKGSTVAMLEAIFRQGGYRVATYTSPHLLRYNERIKVDGVPADDARICRAFAAVERARGGTSLTYFEFGTLAALAIFRETRPDVAILEVGLGGRLDAVNVVDADVAVIAAIGIDHVEWLGNTREAIGSEKAGIMRPGRPAVCSDPETPQSIVAHAAATGAELSLLGHGFHYAAEDDGRWTWWSGALAYEHLPRPSLAGAYQLRNASGVIKAVTLLADRLPVAAETIAAAIGATELKGRFQRIAGPVEFVLDVAHNAQAVEVFVATLKALPPARRTRVILGMLRTKDRRSVMTTLDGAVDEWHFGTVDARHGASAEELAATAREIGSAKPAFLYPSVAAAYAGAKTLAEAGDRVVVVGSFVTVGEVLRAMAPPG